MMNQFESNVQNQTKTDQEKRVLSLVNKELVKLQNPYSKNYQNLYILSQCLSALGNAFSFLTCSFIIYFLLFQGTGLLYISIFLALATGLVIEYGKRYSNELFFHSLIFKKRIRLFLASIVIVFFSISIYGSILACQYMPEQLRTTPQLISLDSIKTSYQQQIASKLSLIDTLTKKSTYRGKITRKGQKTINELNIGILDLEKSRKAEVQKAETENQKTLSQHEKKNSMYAYILAYVMLISELLFIACFWYQKQYIYNSAAERNLINQDQKKTTKIDFVGNAPSQTQQRKPSIGFKLEQQDEKRLKVKNQPFTRNCEQCQNIYPIKRKQQRFCSEKCRKDWHNKNK